MKKQIPVDDLSADTRAVYDVLNDEPDMACVVVGTAYIEAACGSLLEAHLRDSGVTEKLLKNTA